MSGFNTKECNNNGEYEITFYSDSRDDFKTVEHLCRSLIGHNKPNAEGDLISREALKKQLKELLDLAVRRVNDTPNNSPCYRMYVEQENERARLIDLIDNAQAIPLPDFKAGYKQAIVDGKTNFSRQEGEWINHRNDYGHNIADCSLCGKTMQWHDEDEDGVPRYCWYCGAPMKGVKKNEITFDDYLKEQLKDPEFRKEWEKLLDEEKQKGGAE